MANYNSAFRTNYFRVIDEEAYKKLFENIKSSEGAIFYFTKEKEGEIYHGFGGDGEGGYVDPEDEDENVNFDYMITEIQKLLPDDECFVYMETKAEKLRYLDGYALIATNKGSSFLDLYKWIKDTAEEFGVKNDPSPTY